MSKKSTKWRAGWSLVVVLALLLSLPGGLVLSEKVAASEGAASVFLDPSSQTLDVGATTTVQIRIKNVSNLYGAEVHLAFDKNLLEVVDKDGAKDGTQIAPSTDFFAFTPGQYFIHSAEIGGYFIARAEADNAAGTISYVFTLLAPASPVSVGPEGKVLATITFKCLGEGTANIDFVNPLAGQLPVKLVDVDGQPIPILLENIHGAVIIQLEEGGLISGRVICHAENAVVGAWISVWSEDWIHHGWAHTDDQGNYTTTGLPAGTYKMRVTPPRGVYLAPARISDIVVVAGQTTTLNVTLEKGGLISGRVICHAENPVVGAWISVWSEDRIHHGWAQTDADGNYTTTGLPAGTYEMRVYPPQGVYLAPARISDIVVVAGQTTTVNVTLEAGGLISGRVICHAENAVVGAWISVWSEDWIHHGWAHTDDQGNYTTTGLPAGT